jgi:hypothetical protein
MDDTTARGDVEVALDLADGAHVSQTFPTADGGSLLFVGKDLRAERIAPLDPALPARVSQTETVVEPASFIDYITQFKSPTAICRASLSRNSIEAVLDYHGRARETDDGAVPQPLTHTVKLLCPFDLDYAKWRAMFGKGLNQQDFAELLEDMVHTISEPAVADLMEAINDLKIDREVRFKSGRNDRNGTVQITYEEIDAEGTSTGGRVTLPQEVKIVVAVFQGAELVEIVAKLRYRMDKGAVAFILAVPGLDKVERDQFRRIGEKVRTDTSTPVFYTS